MLSLLRKYTGGDIGDDHDDDGAGAGDEGDDCDFDMCEMCIRWALHCDKSGMDLGLA